jgi:hypothetical protein
MPNQKPAAHAETPEGLFANDSPADPESQAGPRGRNPSIPDFSRRGGLPCCGQGRTAARNDSSSVARSFGAAVSCSDAFLSGVPPYTW